MIVNIDLELKNEDQVEPEIVEGIKNYFEKSKEKNFLFDQDSDLSRLKELCTNYCKSYGKPEDTDNMFYSLSEKVIEVQKVHKENENIRRRKKDVNIIIKARKYSEKYDVPIDEAIDLVSQPINNHKMEMRFKIEAL